MIKWMIEIKYQMQNNDELFNQPLLVLSLVCFEAGIMKWTLLKNQLCAQYIMTSLHQCKKVTFNNCIVKWRLGAQNIQELPQLAASS